MVLYFGLVLVTWYLQLGSISYRDISVVSILWIYDTYRIIHFSYTILQTIHFCLTLRYFGHYNSDIPKKFVKHIKFFGYKTRQNISLIHIEYCFMCIVICIVSLKINDIKPYSPLCSRPVLRMQEYWRMES